MTKTFAAQVNKLNLGFQETAVLEYICSESNKLYNCTLYLARQLYFKASKLSNGRWLSSQMKSNPHMQALYISAAQQTCIGVGEAINGYRELLKLWNKGGLESKPKFPFYRKHGLFQISYPKRWLKLTDKGVRIPLGLKCKAWFGISEIFIPFPANLDWDSIKELQIVPKAGYFNAVWIQKKDVVQHNLNPDNCLAIDHGVDNWLTCTSNVSEAFIVDGRHLKSINQFYNKQVSTIKTGKSQNFWCKLLDQITCKRNRTMRDAVNKAARMVINHCIKNDIGTIVFGWNKGQKQNANMGRKTNQKFVQIPTGKLKGRIQQLCEQTGIKFIEQEESYTSQASALDLDSIPVYGEKPNSWKASGRRVKRGLYESKDGTLINADCNGSYNIGRKSNVTGMQRKPARGLNLTSPRRLRLWTLTSTV